MKQYKLLIIAIIFIPLLSGCLFGEQDVPDPKKFNSIINSPIDKDVLSSYVGKYIVTDMDITYGLQADEKTFPYMNGYFNIKANDVTGKFEYTYASEYDGYQTDGEFMFKDIFMPFQDSDISSGLQKDNYTIIFNTPIEITANKLTYKIKSLKKYSDTAAVITDNATTTKKENIVYSTLCDPDEQNNASPNSCSSIEGALKYIGYYRVETITCPKEKGTKYIGGKDFVGEMVAAPNMDGNTQIVTLPIDLKLQFFNNDLKQCLGTTEDILLQKNKYIIDTNANNSDTNTGNDSNSGGLSVIFTKVGLIGLKNVPTGIRISEIDYYPKNPDFTDATFGTDKHQISMRLKIMKDGQLNNPPVKTLTK